MPYYLSSYIDLVDQSGRCILENKRGFISPQAEQVMDQLGINPNTWIDELKGFKSVGYSAVGTVKQLKDYSVRTKKKWTVGLRLAPELE